MEKHFWNLKVPIFQGGMGVGISLGGLAGAVAAEGGAGTISAADIGFREPDFSKHPMVANLRALGKEIRRAREIACGRGMVGVNIMTVTTGYEHYVREAARLGADFIVSGAGLPMELPLIAGDYSTKLIPVVSSEKAARVIFRRWYKKAAYVPDAVIIEGPAAGGHLGFSREEAEACDLERYSAEIKRIIAYVREYGREHDKYIYVITAGGLRTSADAWKMMSLGADALQVASRFVVTEECDAAPEFKQAYIDAKKEDIKIIKSPVGMPGRAIVNDFIKRCENNGRIPPGHCYGCLAICEQKKAPYCITEALVRAATGDVKNGLIFCGANAWQEERITTVREVMCELLG